MFNKYGIFISVLNEEPFSPYSRLLGGIIAP